MKRAHRSSLRLILLLTSFALSTISSAGVIYSSTTPSRAIRITGLHVPALNQTYDVEFPDGSFVELFGDPSSLSQQPTFWGDMAGAGAARDAIVAALNAASPVPSGLESTIGVPVQVDWFVVPYEATGSDIVVQAGLFPAFSTTWTSNALSPYDKNSDGYNLNFSVFSEVVTTPEPASVILAGLALLGLICFARKHS